MGCPILTPLTTGEGLVYNPNPVPLLHAPNHSFTERQQFPLAEANALWETEFLQ